MTTTPQPEDDRSQNSPGPEVATPSQEAQVPKADERPDANVEVLSGPTSEQASVPEVAPTTGGDASETPETPDFVVLARPPAQDGGAPGEQEDAATPGGTLVPDQDGDDAPLPDGGDPRASAAQTVRSDDPLVRGESAHDDVASGAPAATPAPSTGQRGTGGWSKLARAMRPQVTRSQVLAGVLCALLGFALVVQVSQTQEQQLSSLRQSDLVRILDDVTRRAEGLETQVQSLQDTRDELSSGSDQQRAAQELAERQAQTQGILSGRLPAEGPGITLTITEGSRRIPASKLFNILEELRNAGVEVVEINGVRLVTSSYFEETGRGMVVDGQKIDSPYRWVAIGDPSTLETALEIPGGAMASVRNEGASPAITQEDLVTITSTREPQAPQFATPVPLEEGD
jgi:uncharacterized protein YlxW (UPF0749 family)